jgi:hypothetical protein
MLPKCLWCIIFLWGFIRLGTAQAPDLLLRKNWDRVDIPFEYENDFIVIKVIVNDVFPLRFIFDTGAEHTILTQREITDVLQVNYARRIPILGADLRKELYAWLALGLKLNIEGLIAPNRSVLVLEEDYLNFREFAGIDVNGILGADIFRRFVVRINYKQRIISLFDPSSYKPPRASRFTELPLEMDRSKPFITAPVAITGNSLTPCKLLLDTGAALALLVYTNTHPQLQLPQQVVRSNLGLGLGGNIEGFMGRTQKMQIGDAALSGIITHFQEIPSPEDSLRTPDRNGIIGNQILSRFQLIIDYPKGRLFLAPAPGSKAVFKSEKSGMLIAASGKRLDTFTVYDILPDSPAQAAGVQINDRIRAVNGWPVAFHTLEALSDKFYARDGKKINLLIERNGVRFKLSFRLKSLV